MKVGDLAHIDDPMARFAQSMKFLRTLKEVEKEAAKIRDLALLELREDHTQQVLADAVDVSHQRIGALEKKAKQNYVT